MSTGDVAVLGLQIDSSDAVRATATLDKFQASANTAASAADKLSTAGTGSGKAVAALQAAANPAVQALNNMANVTKAASTAHQGMSTQALAAGHSIRSLVEALASGQPITMAFGQQLSHISYAASGPGGISGAFKEATGSLLAFVGPTGLVAGGLVAIAAGGVLALNSIAKVEKQFDDTAHAAGVTIGQLHELAAAANFKGINTDDFTKGIDRFSAFVYDAMHNAGSLNELMIANGQHAKTFGDYFDRAADLIKNASSDQQRLQLLQQAGLPATMDWVRFLSQGSQGIKQAAAEATKFGDIADEAMVRKARAFDEAWQKSITNFSNGFKSGFIEVIGYFDKLNSGVNSLLSKAGVNVGKNLLGDALNGGPTPFSKLTATSSVDDFYKSLGKGAPGNGKTLLNTDLQRQISQMQPPLGWFGHTPTVKQVTKPEKEKENDRDNRRLPAAA